MKRLLIVALIAALTAFVGIAAAQQQAPAPAPAAPAAALTLARMEIAAGVENREPVGAAATFPATQERVYCFMEFTNVPADTNVEVVWYAAGKEMGRVPLAIKAYSKYRTWAYKTIAGIAGDWKVDVVDASGAVLKSAAFKIQ